MTKRKPGRPTKFTPETIEKLTTAIRLGATYEHACNYAGVTYSIFREWMIRGENEKTGAYFDFFETIKGSEGKALVGWLASIEQAAKDGAWQAAAWKAERRYPETYGRQVQDTKHSGEVKIVVEWEAVANDNAQD